MEWCENTMPIGQYLVGRGREGAHLKYRPRDTKSADVRSILRACRDKNEAKLPMVRALIIFLILSSVNVELDHVS